MSASTFVQDLLDAGRVRVTAWGVLPADFEDAVRLLDRAVRSGLAFDPPALQLRSATWALQLIYRASQALVHREIDAEAVRKALADACPEAADPAVCYSVDLSFRLLPDLLSLARGLSEDDPLVTSLVSLAADWPLSSVGAKGVPATEPTPFMADRSLRRLYADRIVEKRDTSRLYDPMTRQAVREAMGACPQLIPAAVREALQVEEASQIA